MMADTEHYGPALPPAAAQSEGHAVTIGPQVPPGLVKQESAATQGEGGEETSAAVAAIGTGSAQGTEAGASAEGEGNMPQIGPMVTEMSHGDEVVQAAEEFERRSRKMKDHLTVKAEAEPGPSKREEWMTELPPEMSKNIGVTARTFSKGAGSDDKDRSDWTDTPADKLKKEKEGKSKKRKREEGEKNPAKQRDQQLQQQVEEYNKKKRPESLIEMHQKSKKKKKSINQNQNAAADSTQTQAPAQPQAQPQPPQTQSQTQTIQQLTPQQQQQLQQQQKKEAKKKKKDKKKGKEEKKERQPFDRDRDLKVNKFDDAQRKAIIKKSAMLNSRFQHSGTTSSFL